MKSAARFSLNGVAFGAVLATGLGINSVRPVVNPAVQPVGLEAQDTHASVSLLGQFRTSLSSWLYLHADLYLHNGVEMRPLAEMEKRAGRQGVGNGEHEHEQLHDDSNIVTVIPSAERDFRGVLGDIERKTSAYRDMTGHKHNDPQTALPLFRVMTYLDPQFIPGWTTGAMVIARDPSLPAARKALAFLQEGRQNNPQSVEILGSIGKLYLTRFIRVDAQRRIYRSYAQAKPYYAQACEIAWSHRETLSEAERDAALENYRFYTLLLRDTGDGATLANTLEQGKKLFPDDPILARVAQ